ncbi:MAG: Glycogen debranching enzyme [Thermodesulfobacterium sp.]|uniref:Glycogen debranching enzyme n=1 Tax=Candidatus Thermodesulfobacterium syntrophicum TaxID=3060442 RepID=A0AAE3P4G1_9BACT|nr:Glycogen debranching enzyme [Candidatus Thermodesulfobacterium syntrophicum]
MKENSFTETYTLKHEESFAIFDIYGNADIERNYEEGIYYKGTRFLSYWKLYIFNKNPILLSSAVKQDNSLFTADLTNPDIVKDGEIIIPKGNIHILRTKFLYENCCYERVYLKNFFLYPVELKLSFYFNNDFADIFEVRGCKRERRGKFFPLEVKKDGIRFVYKGLDNLKRVTEVTFNPLPESIFSNKVTYKLKLNAGKEFVIYSNISCLIEDEKKFFSKCSYKRALFYIRRRLKSWEEKSCKIYTSNEQFNQWLKRSWADIVMLTTSTKYGPYPYAGIPWFNTIFGRDGIITALECLWINPSIAKGTLSFLAYHQAKEFNPEQDAQPGKILHEIRKGEMAATGEIPFAKYYGSIDATPLFVILASKYLERTGDIEFIKSIWENILMAISWIDEYGDIDKDEFVEYLPSKNGLINKGWKDSEDSVFYEDGSLAKPPIALVEIQGYVYKAKKEGSKLARILGEKQLALKWEKEAERLKELIEEKFWCEDIKFFALALDEDKKACKVRASNAGHLLFSKAITPSKARALASLFFEKHFFSGWGIRTLSSLEKRYNPLSYHNGSVWPHDNAIIAFGLSLYGFKEKALRILKALFEASTYFKLHRIPELFCGFEKRPDEGPTHYPVACHPQAWSAGAVFLILQGCLGLSFENNEIHFKHPVLPEFLEDIWIKDLQTKKGKVDLYLKNYGNDVVVNIIKKEGDVKIFIEK